MQPIGALAHLPLLFLCPAQSPQSETVSEVPAHDETPAAEDEGSPWIDPEDGWFDEGYRRYTSTLHSGHCQVSWRAERGTTDA